MNQLRHKNETRHILERVRRIQSLLAEAAIEIGTLQADVAAQLKISRDRLPHSTERPVQMIAPDPNMPRAYSINDASKLLGVSRSVLYAMISRGELKRLKIGRRTLIARNEIDRLVGETPR